MTRVKCLISTGIIFCVIFVALALAWGTAELIVLQPRYLMSMWEQGKRTMKEEEWQNAVDMMHVAVRINPLNSEYDFDLGRLYEWRALEQPTWTRHAQENRARAISYFRESVRRQPVWALAWVNLAASKILNQELDKEAFHALDNAARYGPWEQGVHKKTIWLGLATWQQLPAITQARIKFIVESSIKEDKSVKFIRDAAIHFRWQGNLDALMDDWEQYLKYERF